MHWSTSTGGNAQLKRIVQLLVLKLVLSCLGPALCCVSPDDFIESAACLKTLAPQVFYHLGELDDALSYALGAGALFDLSERSEYVETILGKITKFPVPRELLPINKYVLVSG